MPSYTKPQMTPAEIKTLRKRLKLGADAFAEKLGLTGRHRGRCVYGWEKGQLRPSVARIEKMTEMDK